MFCNRFNHSVVESDVMIVTIEHTGGGDPCCQCPGKQDMHSINIKTEGRGGKIDRLRFCTPCSRRIRDDLNRAIQFDDAMKGMS